jgi:hypothetical protein
MDGNSDLTADPTNVYKLFLCLAGALSDDSLRKAAGNVIAEPGEHPTPYQPNNLPNS